MLDETGLDATVPSMSRLGLDEPIGSGLQRVCVERLDRAIEGLTRSDDPDAGIHAARKSLKRIRGMIRLVRDQVGYRVYREENVVLRDTARRIAPARDAAVLVETLDTIVDRHRSGLGADAFGGVRDRLVERRETIAGRIVGDRQLMSEVVTTLRVSRARFATWPVSDEEATDLRRPLPEGFDAIAGGIERVYRRGRARMADASAERTTVAFHQWRKRVKYLRYQMEALEALWPEVLGAYARSLDELGEALGLEHDLAVLEHTLTHEPQLCPDGQQRRLLGALVLHERAVLRHGAARTGRLAFAEAPEVFTARLHSYWEAVRQ